ncbi:hypothetical protein C8R45DRAFT_1104528 [Mycena sanguinolenta]|nr:hypothetical protein C8R45DRAFT_1104528 [Mycena sanguinolenta]
MASIFPALPDDHVISLQFGLPAVFLESREAATQSTASAGHLSGGERARGILPPLLPHFSFSNHFLPWRPTTPSVRLDYQQLTAISFNTFTSVRVLRYLSGKFRALPPPGYPPSAKPLISAISSS